MKKFLTILALFVMLKSGQTITFSDRFSYTLYLDVITFSDGLDEVTIPLNRIKWVTNDAEAHKMLKLR